MKHESGWQLLQSTKVLTKCFKQRDSNPTGASLSILACLLHWWRVGAIRNPPVFFLQVLRLTFESYPELCHYGFCYQELTACTNLFACTVILENFGSNSFFWLSRLLRRCCLQWDTWRNLWLSSLGTCTRVWSYAIHGCILFSIDTFTICCSMQCFFHWTKGGVLPVALRKVQVCEGESSSTLLRYVNHNARRNLREANCSP